jgi:hypothetical protein
VPFGETTRICVCALTNAISVPSGDQAGDVPWATIVAVPPASGCTTIAGCPSTANADASPGPKTAVTPHEFEPSPCPIDDKATRVGIEAVEAALDWGEPKLCTKISVDVQSGACISA